MRPVLLDLDGTLVDSVFLHVIAWEEAFRAAGHELPMWHIHAAIGMGGDRLVPRLLGEEPADADSLRQAHEERFLDWADRLRPTPGARAFLADLERRAVPYHVATSAKTPVRTALLAALGRDDLPTVDQDAVASSKPAPDLLLAACEALGAEPDDITLVGDSPWDAEAARRVGIRSIAVRCGGFGDDRLKDAGAIAVVDDPRALVGRL